MNSSESAGKQDSGATGTGESLILPQAIKAAQSYAEQPSPELLDQVRRYVSKLFEQRYDVEAVDCLVMTGLLDELITHIQQDTFCSGASQEKQREKEEEAGHLVATSSGNATQVLEYVMQCALYSDPATRHSLLRVAVQIQERFGWCADTVRTALLDGSPELLAYAINACTKSTPDVQLQAALIIAQHGALPQATDPNVRAALKQLASSTVCDEAMNGRVQHGLFSLLCAQLNLSTPQNMKELYKDEVSGVKLPAVVQQRPLVRNIDGLVSALAHCGHGEDTLISSQHGCWVGSRPSPNGCRNASAYTGFLYLRDWMGGLNAIDAFRQSDVPAVSAGAELATGIALCGVCDGYNAGLNLCGLKITPEIAAKPTQDSLMPVLGLGLAYAGTCDKAATDCLKAALDGITNTTIMDLSYVAYSSMALGLINAGSCDTDVATHIVAVLGSFQEDWLANQSISRLAASGLGALVIGAGEAARPCVELVTGMISGGFSAYTGVVMDAFAGVGVVDMQKVRSVVERLQNEITSVSDREADKNLEGAAEEEADSGMPGREMISGDAKADEPRPSVESQDLDPKIRKQLAAGGGGFALTAANGYNDGQEADKDNKDVSATDIRPALVLQLAMSSIAEPTSTTLARRLCERMVQFGGAVAGRAAPLALAFLSLSKPDYAISDCLVRMAHNGDLTTSLNAILALGLLGAGSRNTRLLSAIRVLLTQFSFSYYRVAAAHIAMGLLELGKNALALSVMHSSGRVVKPVAMAAFASLLFSLGTDWDLVRTEDHPLFALLAPVISLRAVITVDHTANPTDVELRVGQPADTVALAGRPRKVTGFTNGNSPVILAPSDRAEASGDTLERVFATDVVEGIVVVCDQERACCDNDAAECPEGN